MKTVRKTAKVFALFLGAFLCAGFDDFPVLVPPELPDVDPQLNQRTIVYAQDEWDAKLRRDFHTLHQGTVTLPIPYEWLKHIEQPGAETDGKKFIDREYLSRFGFLWDTQDSERELPVGFAKIEDVRDPATGEPKFKDTATGEALTGVGFTCSACHTTQLNYQDKGIWIDGGPAMVDLGKFREALALGLVYTLIDSDRRDRFADAVLAESANRMSWTNWAAAKVTGGLDRLKLTKSLGSIVAYLVKSQIERRKLIARFGAKDADEGFGRLDAIGRIGDTVFGQGYDKTNYRPLLAPVSYPHLWHTPWFDWVQYNGSIMQPMVRNAGEALGVGALINLKGEGSRPRFASSVAVNNLHALESILSGTELFGGLGSPKWNESVFGPLDHDKKVPQGKALYREMCLKCHGPPISELRQNADDPQNRLYFSEISGKRYFKVKLIPVKHVGTDPAMAKGMKGRTVRIAGLDLSGVDPSTEECGVSVDAGATQAPFGIALALVVEKAVSQRYDELNIPPASRAELNGFRPNCILDKNDIFYKARPLDGIWATAPYLHNGSVPNLYLLLGNKFERDEAARKFHVGSRDFDPEKVGFSYRDDKKGYFQFDTDVPGNSNAGHEFIDVEEGGSKDGVVGRKLGPQERYAIIEYLKSL